MTIRRTKIVATLGPASNSPEVIEALILAGLDVARLNFSHGTPDEHIARARLIREIAARHGRHVALLGDLQGPKIRIAKFTDKRIELKVGDTFSFSTSHPLASGNERVVGINYPDLVKDCGVGDQLLLDDGRVVMRVESTAPDALNCIVTVGGPLSDHKGINRKGEGSLPSHRLHTSFRRCDESNALAALYTANHFPGVKAIISLTESGFTPLIMSRLRSHVPIYALSPHRATQARASLFRGVYPIAFDPASLPSETVSEAALGELLKRDLVQPGGWIILTKGDRYDVTGGTNGLKILQL